MSFTSKTWTENLQTKWKSEARQLQTNKTASQLIKSSDSRIKTTPPKNVKCKYTKATIIIKNIITFNQSAEEDSFNHFYKSNCDTWKINLVKKNLITRFIKYKEILFQIDHDICLEKWYTKYFTNHDLAIRIVVFNLYTKDEMRCSDYFKKAERRFSNRSFKITLRIYTDCLITYKLCWHNCVYYYPTRKKTWSFFLL